MYMYAHTSHTHTHIYIYLSLSQSHTADFEALNSTALFFHPLPSQFCFHPLSSGLPWIGHCVTRAQPQTSIHCWSKATWSPQVGKVETMNAILGQLPLEPKCGIHWTT